MRALARDLGRALGVGAHVTALRRTRSGPFSLADARPLDEVLATLEAPGGKVDEAALPLVAPADALRHLERRVVTDRSRAMRASAGGSLWNPARGRPMAASACSTARESSWRWRSLVQTRRSNCFVFFSPDALTMPAISGTFPTTQKEKERNNGPRSGT